MGKRRVEPPDVAGAVAPESPPEAGAPQEAAADPQTAEIQRLREREDELLRALAEQQNVLRRRRQEMDASLRYAQEELIRELLPVLDDFERAILATGAGPSDPIRAGVALVHDRLARTLERRGLSAIRPLGEAFDPALHDAVAERPEPGAAAGTVLEVVVPGYRLGDRVLRHAKVVVAGGSHPADEAPGPAQGPEAKER
jgi:molecular chaperone GrpE